MDIAGELTTHGTGVMADRRPPTPRPSRRLRAAGAIVVGKTNMPELALWPHLTESQTRARPATRGTRSAGRRLERRQRGRGRRRHGRAARSAPTAAARSASRRRLRALRAQAPARARPARARTTTTGTACAARPDDAHAWPTPRCCSTCSPTAGRLRLWPPAPHCRVGGSPSHRKPTLPARPKAVAGGASRPPRACCASWATSCSSGARYGCSGRSSCRASPRRGSTPSAWSGAPSSRSARAGSPRRRAIAAAARAAPRRPPGAHIDAVFDEVDLLITPMTAKPPPAGRFDGAGAVRAFLGAGEFA